jgi:anti-sigma factor RsiW
MTSAPTTACARVEGRLPQLLDGSLPPLDEARDRGHLEACSSCRRELEGFEHCLAELPRACASGGEHEVEALVAGVLGELRRGGSRRAPVVSRPLVAAAVAATVLACLRLWFGEVPAHAAPPEAEFGALLERLPGWSEILGGLGELSRWVS